MIASVQTSHQPWTYRTAWLPRTWRVVRDLVRDVAGGATARWLAFWALTVAQLVCRFLHAKLHRTLPLVRQLLGTPYRATRLSERFYGTRVQPSPGGVLFWTLLSFTYLVTHFFLIAVPTSKGYANFIVLRASASESPSTSVRYM